MRRIYYQVVNVKSAFNSIADNIVDELWGLDMRVAVSGKTASFFLNYLRLEASHYFHGQEDKAVDFAPDVQICI